ncbi:MAG TPA: phenylalanine--tRNA ligase subunit alpha, partial [Thermoplasmataceae archaeon]|nr:phenylalanine--tRNA ligase subunit alpha [Thermoplasmataceae archaeon]
IDIIREIFLSFGFREMSGHYIETAFWNMDALFIPQDHPARDLQDTFFLEGPEMEIEHQEVIDSVRRSHEKGIRRYRGWEYKWSMDKAKQPLLRTHTTVSTIRTLYELKECPVALFSIEKVFRHESVDWKHLAELHQIEGAYYASDANLSTLKWLMTEFYSRLGFDDIRLVPSYYPYTEPSMDVVAYINGREIELGGSGIFRPEVTIPLGLKEPVIAWGLGLERLAMIFYGLDDIRRIYSSDLNWLRSFTLKMRMER